MIFCDTEYNDKQVLLWCSEKSNGADKVVFDLREPSGVEQLRNYINENLSEEFIAYAASAEITSLLRLGIDVTKMKWVDALVECRVITQSHRNYLSHGQASLLSQVKALLGESITETKEEKERMVNLIITNESWNDEEWADIVKYCQADVSYIPRLMKKVVEVYKENGTELNYKAMLDRGYQVRICAEMDYASRGFPVYGNDIFTIFNNKLALKRNIIRTLPMIWLECYENNVLKRKKVLALIERMGWVWARTENGGPNLSADYLKELKLVIPEVEPLYQVIKTTSTLNSKSDILEKVKDGYVKNKTFCYTAVTGRNGLRQSSGYLLNFPKWIRKVIKPHPGMAFVGFDWSQQEIAIGAAVSGDASLLKAYNSGDIYLELGKMSGRIPKDGKKEDYAVERQMFKALQLGLAYGKGKPSLTRDISVITRGTMSEEASEELASAIFDWHQTEFHRYWSWNKEFVNMAYVRGFCDSIDGFRKWVDSLTPQTQLKNFPCQANGAYMLREAVKMVYKEWKDGNIPPLLCSQHDALYFNVEEIDAERVEKIVKGIMEQASVNTIGVMVRVDSNVYTNDNPYVPDGYNKTHEDLWEMATKVDSLEKDLVK